MLHLNMRYLCRILQINQVSGSLSFRTLHLWNLNNRCNRFPLQILLQKRFASSNPELSVKHRSVVLYLCGGVILFLGASYAAVPAYRMFCQATGLGGTTRVAHDVDKIDGMNAVQDRTIRVKFVGSTHGSCEWDFRPQQSEITVHPGETALAFFKARNPTDRPIIGISTYNIVPYEVGQYFNKIQCFCFEEQMLQPGETVDMPVFFYLDPDFAEDPNMEFISDIVLSYTFFEAKKGLKLPQPLTNQDYVKLNPQ